MRPDLRILECQTCGTTVRQLDDSELHRIQTDPYAFVVFCKSCHLDDKAHMLVEWEGIPFKEARILAKQLEF